MAIGENQTGSQRSAPPARRSKGASQDTMICPCEEITLSDMQSFLSANPGMSYESFIESTGAGTRCTACLLDLEYHFVDLNRGVSVKSGRGGPARRRQSVPVKQRLYRAIDRLTPDLPIKLYDYFPVLYGPDLDQWFWDANYSLLYEDQYVAPPFQLDLCLRDGEGRTVWRNRLVLESGQGIRECLSERLRDAEIARQGGSGGTMLAEIGVGSLKVLRRGRRAGFRGTTRPQTEIVTAASACAVHGQGASVNLGGEFTCLYRPGEERTFLSIMNAGTKPVTVDLHYPVGVYGEVGDDDPAATLTVPAYGARLHEIRPTGGDMSPMAGLPYKILWRGRGQYKAHIFVATPSLDRFSIDHV